MILYDHAGVTLHLGDCREILRELPDESVHAVVTSPPYWGLRDYGVEPSVWGGDPACAHAWGRAGRRLKGGPHAATDFPPVSNTLLLPQAAVKEIATGVLCGTCGAWRGVLGLEPLHDCLAWARGIEPCAVCYVCHLVVIFREVRRVLRSDGTLWLNLGDCYATSAGKVGAHPGGGEQGARWATMGPMTPPNRLPMPGLKPKDLVLMPARVALALQADGWWVRQRIAWCKRAGMPESVEDRPTSAVEDIFLLAKRDHYYYDHEAVKEPLASTAKEYLRAGQSVRAHHALGVVNGRPLGPASFTNVPTGRNLRNYWLLSPAPYAGAHFAVFPTELPRRAILAGTSARGCCRFCGAPWARIVSRRRRFESGSGRSGVMPGGKNGPGLQGGGATLDVRRGPVVETATIGWRPTCRCPGQRGRTVPAVVLDPFSGAGTTGLVATRLGRQYIGIELNREYAETSVRRIVGDAPLFL